MARRNIVALEDLLDRPAKTHVTKFMGQNIEVKELSVAQVREFQEGVKAMQADNPDADVDGTELQRDLIRMAVIGADKLTDDQIDSFPMGEVIKLGNDIIRISGLNRGEDSGNA